MDDEYADEAVEGDEVTMTLSVALDEEQEMNYTTDIHSQMTAYGRNSHLFKGRHRITEQYSFIEPGEPINLVFHIQSMVV